MVTAGEGREISMLSGKHFYTVILLYAKQSTYNILWMAKAMQSRVRHGSKHTEPAGQLPPHVKDDEVRGVFVGLLVCLFAGCKRVLAGLTSRITDDHQAVRCDSIGRFMFRTKGQALLTVTNTSNKTLEK